MAKPVTMPTRNRMRQQRAAGTSYAKIASRNGVSEGTAQRHTKDVPVPSPRAAFPPKKIDREKARQLKASGLSYDKVGEALGVSGPGVFFALNGRPSRARATQ